MIKSPAPKSIPPECRENIFNYLIEKSLNICPIAFREKGYFITPDCLHHAGIHNTKLNRKLYPAVVHSVFNLMAVKNDPWHLTNASYGIWKGDLRAQGLQKFLERHPMICKWVNNPV